MFVLVSSPARLHSDMCRSRARRQLLRDGFWSSCRIVSSYHYYYYHYYYYYYYYYYYHYSTIEEHRDMVVLFVTGGKTTVAPLFSDVARWPASGI